MKSRIKPVFKCPEDFKHLFGDSRCLLTISVGQEVHEGEKFQTTVDLINQSFKEVIILVDDTLQRHTIKLENDLPMDRLHQLALKEGDEWLKRNERFYHCLTIPYKIIRWDHWLNHPHYTRQYQIIYHRYLSDREYQQDFDLTIRDFLTRCTKRRLNSDFSFMQGYSLCLNYLLEECTALCLWVEENINFEVYPSRRNPAMSATHALFIKPQHPDLLLPVAIKFKNRKQLSPQKFLSEIS